MIKLHNTIGLSFEKVIFSNNEILIKLNFDPHQDVPVLVEFVYESNDEIFELQLLVDLLRSSGISEIMLEMCYIPYSRQDRKTDIKESFSLKTFCNVINSMGFSSITVKDPHSDVSLALLDNVIPSYQHEIFSQDIGYMDNPILVSPDGGALKKIYDVAKKSGVSQVIECSKKRNTVTGEITETKIYCDEDIEGRTCIIVDDICEGGRTFIEIAKLLKERKVGKIVLMVTHGFFSKGLGVFDELIDEIYTSKGQVK